MRVMISLNLADIMTAIRPITHETPNNEVDPAELNQELPINSEQKNATEMIE